MSHIYYGVLVLSSKYYFLRMAMSIVLSTKVVMYELKHDRV